MVQVPAGLEEVAGRARPVALAAERVLPVLPALEPLLPHGLRRGTVVTVSGSVGCTSLAMGVAAAASQSGSWCAAAVTDPPSLGLVAAAELGIALERFPVAVVPNDRFAWTVAALLDAFDVVVAWPPASLRAADARRLGARGRERGSTLIVDGRHWPETADLRLHAVGTAWHGVGRGHGRLEARQLDVVATGRGAAAQERRARVWL